MLFLENGEIRGTTMFVTCHGAGARGFRASVFSLFCLTLAVNTLACTSAAEDAAYLLNAMATDAKLVSGDYEMPSRLNCGGRRYLLNGGEFSFSWSPSVPTDAVDLDIDTGMDASGPDVFGIGFEGGESDPSFVCKVKAAWAYDATTNRPKGAGVVTGCDGFKCEVNGIKVTCAELAETLPKFGCD